MYRRWLLGVSLAILSAGPLAAQDQAAVLRRMEAQLDSMQRVVELRDSMNKRASSSDTVVAGGLRIATSPKFLALATAAAEAARRGLEARFGAAVTARVRIPVIQFGGAHSPVSPRADTSVVARGFERMATDAIWRQQGTLFTGWLRGSVPGTESTPSDWSLLAEELQQTPARPNRACFEGAPAACAIALGLRLGPDTLAEWYAPDTWPRLAKLVWDSPPGRDRMARQRCIDSGDETACRIILTPSRILLPVSVGGRRRLIQQALEAGGAGAFERLIAPGDRRLDDRLSDAAGLPIDTLLARWSAAVRAEAPHGPARPAWELLLGLAWSAVLLAAVLGGPRWR